jgi:hypothetical protein
MLIPDEQLALDLLDALDSRHHLDLNPALTKDVWRERCCLEQQLRMMDALLDWLERWMTNPQNSHFPPVDGSPRQPAASLYRQLLSSRAWVQDRVEDLDEAADWVFQELCQPKACH